MFESVLSLVAHGALVEQRSRRRSVNIFEVVRRCVLIIRSLTGSVTDSEKIDDIDDIDTLDSFSVVSTSSTDVQREDAVERNGTAIQKDGELWLDDGTVVIVANGAVAYRVYKGTLGSVSPVFRDLMADSNLKDSELMDGVPVVRVDDAPENLRHFLNFLAQPRFE